MKSIIDAKSFSAALKKAAAVVPKKSSVPALTGILAEFTEDSCRLTATDLNVWMRATCGSDGDAFSFIFPDAQGLERLCRRFDGKLTVELWEKEEEQTVTLRGDGKAAEFPVLSAQDYPESPGCEAPADYHTDAAVLYERVKSVKYATRWIDQKPTLSGVRFEGAHVFCVDGFRMAVNDDAGLTVKEPFIVPASSLAYLKEFGKADIAIAAGAKYVSFASGDAALLCRRIEASDSIHVETAIPRTSAETYHVDREQFADAIRYLLDCSAGMRQPYVLFRDKHLTLWNGKATYQAKVETDGAAEKEYAFDLRYMKDALTQFSGEKYVQIKTSGGISPLVLSAGGGATALVLTVRLGGAWMKGAA